MLSKFHRGEEGFTLIELMVVVLIIAILIAIAIPTFIGMRDRGYDSQSKSNLRNGITAAKTYFTDNEAYTGMDSGDLSSIEDAVNFSDTATNCTNSISGSDSIHSTVYVQTGLTGSNACLSAWTKGSDKWYYWTSDSLGERLSIR